MQISDSGLDWLQGFPEHHTNRNKFHSGWQPVLPDIRREPTGRVRRASTRRGSDE